MTLSLYPVILSGGSGTRLWPLSRAALPKQLLPLASDRTMLQETMLRLKGIEGLAAPMVICNDDHRFMIAEQLREIEITPSAIMLEPVGRNTAPAVAVAALRLMRINPEALMLVLPADHLIRDVPAFHASVAKAEVAAQAGYLTTFGIVAQTPETGYGYIRRGEALAGADGGHAVASFVEKPDRTTAQSYLDSGDYYWNSGMFLFKASVFVDELKRLRADILSACEVSLTKAVSDLDFIRLDKEAFAACPAESIDYAVMEHTGKAAVVPADIGWNDIGAWSSLWEVSDKDARDNVLRGDVLTEDAHRNFIRAESRLVAALGVDNLVIVETPDAVLVASKDRVQDVKKLVDRLKADKRDEHVFHRKVYRPWGWYEGIDEGERFQVKRIMVKPGEKLSLQMHHHRAEHWIIVTGTARITRDDETFLLTENQSTYIPLGSKHRLENPGKFPLHMVEVQSGGYLGEDDIVRFEDVYKRT